MATNKNTQQGQSSRSGNQGASKGGSQKRSSGAGRKSTMQEEEKENVSSGIK